MTGVQTCALPISQQFGTRIFTPTRGVNEVQLSNVEQQRMEHRLDELTSLMRQLVVDPHQPFVQGPALVCSICSYPSHPTDACLTLQDGSPTFQDQSVAAAGVFLGKPQFQQQQQRYDPFSTTYNPGWRDHPNLSYGNAAAPQQSGNHSNINPKGLPQQDLNLLWKI